MRTTNHRHLSLYAAYGLRKVDPSKLQTWLRNALIILDDPIRCRLDWISFRNEIAAVWSEQIDLTPTPALHSWAKTKICITTIELVASRIPWRFCCPDARALVLALVLTGFNFFGLLLFFLLCCFFCSFAGACRLAFCQAWCAPGFKVTTKALSTCDCLSFAHRRANTADRCSKVFHSSCIQKITSRELHSKML